MIHTKSSFVRAIAFAAFALLPAAALAQARPEPTGDPKLVMTIDEYEPKSTVKVPQNLVTRAKYPVIDVHNHQSLTPDPARHRSLRTWRR